MPTTLTTVEPATVQDDRSALPPPLAGYDEAIEGLRETGRIFWQRGWSLGTSSNYSVVASREPLELIVTASGMDKGRLERGDFVRVNDRGQPTVAGQPKSSAETLLHVVAAEQPGVGAVLHTHSVWCTVLSDLFARDGVMKIEGYEMLKGFAGVTTHETTANIEIFPNTQDIPVLAAKVKQRLCDKANPLKYGYMIHKHGLYTWGKDLAEARRHIEILEFLLECEYRRLALKS